MRPNTSFLSSSAAFKPDQTAADTGDHKPQYKFHFPSNGKRNIF